MKANVIVTKIPITIISFRPNPFHHDLFWGWACAVISETAGSCDKSPGSDVGASAGVCCGLFLGGLISIRCFQVIP